MGRFDALSNLEEKKAPEPVVSPPLPKPEPPRIQIRTAPKVKKEIKPIPKTSFNKTSAYNTLEQPEKYSTLIDASIMKKTKVYAAQNDLKDYQVIDIALREFFNKHK